MPHNYSSWLLRYVPDSVRGEFINVGVIVGRNDGDWAGRFTTSYARANRLGGNAALLRPTLRAIQDRIFITNGDTPPTYRGFTEMATQSAITVATMEELATRFNNALQISETRAAYGNSAEELAEMLYSHLVHDEGHQSYSRSRTVMRNEFRNAMVHEWRGADLRLIDRPTVLMGRQRQQFDFALGQTEVDQMTHVISITRKDQELVQQEINAWNYSVGLIRDRGGVVLPTGGGEQMPVERSVPIMLVHDRPTTSAQTDLLEIAREGWTSLGVKDVDQAGISSAVRSVRHLVAS